MVIEQTIEIPADRRITLEVPREIPAGRVILTFTPVSMPSAEPQRGDFPSAGEKSAATRAERLAGALASEDESSDTPIANRLLGACANLGNITIEEIRDERLSKYL